jgi:hypothetical protein
MAEFTEIDKHNILVPWWRESCKEFGLFYLMKTEAERRQILLSCSPDMPDEPAGTRQARDQTITATDMLLPELFMQGLQAGQGRCLILLLARRLVSPDTGLENDLKLMKSLHSRKEMPIFSGGKLDAFDTPFVDIRDPSKEIQCLTEESSPTTVQTTHQWLKEGRLVDADVWLSCTMRRNILADFMMGLKGAFCRDTERREKDGGRGVSDSSSSTSSGGHEHEQQGGGGGGASTLDDVEE